MNRTGGGPSRAVDPAAAAGEVEDMAVDESGLWLAVATEKGTQIYVAEADGRSGQTEKPDRRWRLVTMLDEAADAPVHGVAWAPSSFYSAAVVTCCESGKVSLWRAVDQMGHLEEVYRTMLSAPAWRVSWAPQEYGRLFGVGAADGSITTFTGVEAVWVQHHFVQNPQQGCCGLAFAPFLPSGALLRTDLHVRTPVDLSPLQLVSCDGGEAVSVWVREPWPQEEVDPAGEQRMWRLARQLPLEFDEGPAMPLSGMSWREVAWAKNNGLPFHYVAAGSAEGAVAIWVFNEAIWRLVLADVSHPAAVTRLSWSEVGSFLLVSYADSSVVMWRETPGGGWEVATEIEADGNA